MLRQLEAGLIDFMNVEVKEVQIRKPKKLQSLYNLSVEEDESYIAKGFVVHNCAHGLTAYFPELSPDQEVRMDPAEQELVNQHGYKKAQELAYRAQEQQRYIERQIRNWKMRGITALDDAEAKKAYNKVLHWQTAMRTHIKDNSFLRRHYEVGKGYIREHVAGWDAFHANVNRK